MQEHAHAHALTHSLTHSLTHTHIQLYTQAIEAVPEAAYLANRAAAYIMVQNFPAAHSDAVAALRLDPSNITPTHTHTHYIDPQ